MGIVSGLTSDVGPRLDGSAREVAARDWAVARLKVLGLANVHVEPFTIKVSVVRTFGTDCGVN